MICSVNEVAERCNVSRQTVNTWIRKGYLKKHGRGEVELHSSMSEWIDANTREVRVLVEK